jgi:hypothetical protein
LPRQVEQRQIPSPGDEKCRLWADANRKEAIMALIQTVVPENAEGEVKEIYTILQNAIGVIPTPMLLASASPGLIKMQWEGLQYFTTHPKLTFPLLSTIRYLVAEEYDYAYCTSFNKELLKKQGVPEEDIEKLTRDPEKAPLEDKDRALVAFVMKAIKTPDAVAQADMDRLHALGWSDSDIVDAVFHGVSMIGSSILMKAFKMDIAC